MSINVNVSGNPISIRRGKMVLSDFENIRRTDREHRKRLRLEQVKEQSKAIAKRILEKARRINKEELERLDKDGNTEMHQAYNRKLMEIVQRYQDIENIGYAHENAANQPDIESLKQAEEEKNQALARARGAEAAQRLQETNQAVSPRSRHLDRLNRVRDLEDERAHMVAQLPKKSCAINDDLTNDENVEVTSSKRKFKRVVSKKTPIKKIPKTSFKSNVHHGKTPSRISVTINGEDLGSSSKKSPSANKSKKTSPSKTANVPKKVSDITEEGNFGESDDNEPRKTLPVTSKPSRFSHVESYEINGSSDLSSSSSTSSHSSNDSSYYSDNASKNTAIRVTPKLHPTPVASKVSLYDHNTRQRNTYDMPSDLVEKVNAQDERNAEDLAREMRELQRKESAMLATQMEREKQRCEDAMRREKVRKDYRELLKRLEELYNEDLKLRAKEISSDRDQQVLAPSKTHQDKIKRQKKMDRAFQTILRNAHELGVCDRPIERPITITPRDQRAQTHATGWKDPPYFDARESDCSSEDGDEYEKKRKLLDLLMKVEKSKRRLLQEYGDDLPDNVFNTVMNSFDRTTSTPSRQDRTQCHGHSQPGTSEIQVINMSGCNDDKSTQKYTCKPQKPRAKLPVGNFVRQCSKNKNTAKTCDQQIQVELKEDEPKEKEAKRYPIEPVIKIVTPENVDSSTSLSSNSSAATDVVIDVDRQGITVDRKKKDGCGGGSVRIGKKSSVTSVKTGNCNTPVKIKFDNKAGGKSLHVTGLLIDKREIQLITQPASNSPEVEQQKKQSPIVSGLCNSLPDSRKSSPSKKLSRSAPPTGHSSPKRSPSRSRASGNYVEQRRYRTQYTQVSIDSSTESSQLNSTSDTGNGSRLLHTRFQALAAKRVVTTTTTNNGRGSSSNSNNRHAQETSDASTTYASPPGATACAMLDAMNSSTPILELLESSSANEMLRRKAGQVSPVSSPETPSPRTMKLPSNIPRPDNRAGRNLRLLLLDAAAAAARTTGPSSTSRSTRTSYNSPSTNKSSSAKTHTTTPRTSHQPCTCKNPACKLFHDRVEEQQLQQQQQPQQQLQQQQQQTYNMAHCPVILKTFEDLQNVYTERIASLTDLIELVRNEQTGLELSAITSENSKMTSRSDATSQPPTSGNLMKNIEAIHAQLKKTLEDSEKIITSKDIALPKSSVVKRDSKTSEKSPNTSTIDLSKETAASESLEDEVTAEPAQHATPTGPPKPRIVSEQRVNIPLDRFQRVPKPAQTSVATGGDLQRKSTGSATRAATSTAESLDRNEQMVEMLSKEILEQSKSINKSPPVDNLKDSDDSLLKQSQAALKDSGDSSKHVVSTDEHENQSGNLDTSNSDYVPLLAGIPKIARTKNSSNSRTRPPVTLISGPYRPEIVSVSPAHELSTIVEFDTPDTANKSQVSTRSPSNKARKKLLPTGGGDAAAAVVPPPLTPSSTSKSADANVTKSKPSLQVAPLPMHQSAKQSPKKSLEKSPRRSVEQSPRRSSDKSSKKSANKSLESWEKSKRATAEADRNLSSGSMHTLPELHIEQLQQSQDNADGNYYMRISQISELQSLPDETIDRMLVSELYEESKSVTPEQRKIHQQHRQQERTARDPGQDKGELTLTSTASLSAMSGVSEISTTPSSDAQQFKCPSSSDEMELAFKRLGLGSWVPTLKKTREASALGSSSSSDVTPVNTGSRLVSSVKKDSTPHEQLLAEISDVSSISVKYENKSTERSVLGRAGRTSTPNRHLMRSISNRSNDSDKGSASKGNAGQNDSLKPTDRSNNSNHFDRSNNTHRSANSNRSNNSNSDGTVSLSSFSSDIDIVVQNQSAEMSVPNISFSNNNLG